MAQKQLNHIFFENSLKSMQIFQILMGGMNFRERLQRKPNVLSGEEWNTYTLWKENRGLHKLFLAPYGYMEFCQL